MSENLNQFQDFSEEEDQFDRDLESLDLDD